MNTHRAYGLGKKKRKHKRRKNRERERKMQLNIKNLGMKGLGQSSHEVAVFPS